MSATIDQAVVGEESPRSSAKQQRKNKNSMLKRMSSVVSSKKKGASSSATADELLAPVHHSVYANLDRDQLEQLLIATKETLVENDSHQSVDQAIARCRVLEIENRRLHLLDSQLQESKKRVRALELCGATTADEFSSEEENRDRAKNTLAMLTGIEEMVNTVVKENAASCGQVEEATRELEAQLLEACHQLELMEQRAVHAETQTLLEATRYRELQEKFDLVTSTYERSRSEFLDIQARLKVVESTLLNTINMKNEARQQRRTHQQQRKNSATAESSSPSSMSSVLSRRRITTSNKRNSMSLNFGAIAASTQTVPLQRVANSGGGGRTVPTPTIVSLVDDNSTGSEGFAEISTVSSTAAATPPGSESTSEAKDAADEQDQQEDDEPTTTAAAAAAQELVVEKSTDTTEVLPSYLQALEDDDEEF